MNSDDINDIWNIALLALCVWREARGEPYDGKVGVAWSVKNRIAIPHAWWGQTYPDVILKPYQYSSFNSNDPNATKLPADPEKNPVWKECLTVAEQVYSGAVSDPTGGATNYYATTMPTPPEWASQMTFTVQLGAQRFYRAS